MSQPAEYDVKTDFTTYQSNASWFPGSPLNVEFNNLATTTDQIRANLALIQRDDGALANASVTFNSLSPALQTAGLSPLTTWVSGKAYTQSQAVIQGTSLYQCQINHVSGTFGADLGAGDWLLLANLSLLSGTVSVAANLVAAGPTTGAAASPNFRSLVGADMPAPTSTSLGGVQSIAAQTSKWINTISTAGAPSLTQPSISDLQNVAANSLVGNNTGSAATPIPLTLAQTLDMIGSAAQGDVLFRGASVWKRLPVGASTNVLSSNGAGADLSWAASAAGSSISSEAQAEAGTDNITVMTPQCVSQAFATNAHTFANIAGRNGGFEVWQSGTSIPLAASAVGYTVDGWYLFTGVGEASTVSRQTGNTSGSSYSCRVQRNAGQTGTTTQIFGFPLDVDELKKMAGQSVILQFSVSTGANWSPTTGVLSYMIYTGTGTPAKQYLGTYLGSVTAISGTASLAQGAAATTVFSSIVAIAANIGQAEIQFTWTPVGTAGANDWFQLDDVSLSVVPAGISAIKPAFERSDFIWDLQRCQRHMATSYDYGTVTGANTLNGIEGGINFARNGVPANLSFPVHVAFPATMRVAPTISYWDHSGNASKFSEGSNNSFVANIGAATIQLITARSFQAYSAAGFSLYLHYQADARI